MSRLLWHSNAAWCRTGYGQQTALFAPRIRDLGHDMALSANWGLSGSMFQWEEMPVYPSDDAWGQRMLPQYAHHHRADLVITLMDMWVLEGRRMRDLKMLCWTPVDHHPIPPKVLKFFVDHPDATPVAMSRFGQRMFKEAGMDAAYVPHGVDTGIYCPGDRQVGRDRMGFPDDAWIVGVVAANKGNNPPRKAFPQLLQAFAEVRKQVPEAHLYMHTDLVGQRGVHLAKFADQLGIPAGAIRAATPLQLELGAPDEAMVDMFRAFDVLALPSYGEGFGVPLIEAQACGTPVVTTDGTAMRELRGAGWLVDAEPWYDAAQDAFFDMPSVRSITDCLLNAYECRGDSQLRSQARRFAEHYDADRVLEEHWKPVLKKAGVAAPARELAAA